MDIFSKKLYRFFNISLVAGLFCTVLIFLLHSDEKNSWQLGLSTRRLGLALFMLVICWGFYLITLQLNKRTAFGNKVSLWIKDVLEMSLGNSSGIQISTMLFGAILGYLYLVFGDLLHADYYVWLVRLVPVALWGLVIITQILICYLSEVRKQEHGILIFVYGGITILSVILFFIFVSSIFDFTVDDAYITYRYSQNVVNGLGPTYNATLPRAEGYTTFLWMVLMTIPHFLGINVVLFGKLLGIICTLAVFLVIALLVTALLPLRHRWLRLVFASVSTFLIATYPETAIHAISGMETALYTMFVTVMALVILLGIKHLPKLVYFAPLIGLFLGLTRPEGNLIALFMLVFTWLLVGKEERVKLLYAGIFFYIIPGGIYYIWRTYYYSLPFPLSFYVKALKTGQVFAGTKDVTGFLIYILPSLGIFLILAFLRFKKELFVLVIPTVVMLIFYLFPAHIMGYNWRFLYPILPLVIALATYGSFVLYLAIDMYSHGTPAASKMKLAVILFSVLFVQLIPWSKIGDVFKDTRETAYGMKNVYVRLGNILHDYKTDDPALMAIGDAGAIPYYSQWEVIDLIGLNNRTIALSDLPNVEYMAQLEPDLVVIASQEREEFRRDNPNDWQNEYYNKAVELGLDKIRVLKAAPDYYLWLLADENSDLSEYLNRELSRSNIQ